MIGKEREKDLSFERKRIGKDLQRVLYRK